MFRFLIITIFIFSYLGSFSADKSTFKKSLIDLGLNSKKSFNELELLLNNIIENEVKNIGQEAVIKELENYLNTSKNITPNMEQLVNYQIAYVHSINSKSPLNLIKAYLDKAKKIAETQNNYCQALSYDAVFATFMAKSGYDQIEEAEKKLWQVFKLAKENNCYELTVISLNHIAKEIYDRKNVYDEGLKLRLKAADLADSFKLKSKTVAIVYNQTGSSHLRSKNYREALKYFHKSKNNCEINKENGRPYTSILNSIALTYAVIGNKDSASHYYDLCLKNAELKNDTIWMAFSKGNKAAIYLKEGQYEKALELYQFDLKYSKLYNEKSSVTFCCTAIAECYLNLKNIDYFKLYLDSAAYFFEKNHASFSNRDGSLKYQFLIKYNKLYRIFEEQNKNFENALKYHKLEFAYNDTLLQKIDAEKANQAGAQYFLNKKEKDLAILQEKSDADQELINQQRIGIFIFIIVLIFVCILLIKLNIANKKQIRSNKKLTEFANEIELQSQKLKQQNEKLEETNLLKSKLFTLVGHDLKNPLSSLRSLIDLYKSNALTENEFEIFINEIDHQLQNVFNLLDNLFAWSKKQLDGLNLQFDYFNVRLLVQETKGLLLPSYTKKNIKIIHHTCDNTTVYADREIIKTIIRNIISNAIKFTPENGQIEIDYLLNENYLIVGIKDNGVGISKEKQHLIFDNSHYSTAGTAQEKGNGLGLLICKDFIELNKGKIWFESEENVGSTFYISIPVSKTN